MHRPSLAYTGGVLGPVHTGNKVELDVVDFDNVALLSLLYRSLIESRLPPARPTLSNDHLYEYV